MQFAPNSQWHVFGHDGVRKYLNAEERERFLAVVQRQPPEVAALCLVLVFTGCRITEALRLTRHTLDLQQAIVTFRTLKRRRQAFRTVPIPQWLAVQLAGMVSQPSDHFWSWHRTTAWRHVRRVMEEACIDGPMACCKGLRHGFGMHAAQSCVPLNLIQRWMGHASSTTTAIYLDAVGIEEREFATRMW